MITYFKAKCMAPKSRAVKVCFSRGSHEQCSFFSTAGTLKPRTLIDRALRAWQCWMNGGMPVTSMRHDAHFNTCFAAQGFNIYSSVYTFYLMLSC